MEELSLHIEYLLLWHDCVIVPGFGAFIAGRRGAQIDHAAGKILPPCREIAFNREVMTDDGLLAHSLARRESLTFEEGRVRMQAAIAEIKTHLLSEREVTLGHVGTLILGDEGTIEFHPFRRAEAGAAAMGMYEASMLFRPSNEHLANETQNATELEEIDSDVAQATDKTDEDAEASALVSGGESEEEMASAETSKGGTSSPYYVIRIRKTYAHIAASLMLIAVLAVSLLLPSGERTTDKALASVVPVEAISRTMRSTTGSEKSATDKKAKEEKLLKETEKASTPEVTEQEENGLLPYYLIVATFRTTEEADRYIATSSEKGLMRVDGNRLHRVAIAADSKKENLQALLNSPEFKKQHAGAWIWESK